LEKVSLFRILCYTDSKEDSNGGSYHGYAKKDAMDAIIKSEASDDETVEEILKKALKCMSRI